MNVLTIEEIIKLLKTTNETYDYTTYAIIMTTLYTGMRQGEVLGLRWKDVDLKNEAFDIKKNLQKVNKKLEPLPPKTDQLHGFMILGILSQHSCTKLE